MESILLPRGIQEPFLEDALADLLVPGLKGRKIVSVQDATTYTLESLKAFIEVTSAFLAGGAVKRIAIKLMLYSAGQPAPTDGQLAKLMKSAKINERDVVPFVQMNKVDGRVQVTLRLPEFDMKDSINKRNLESLLLLTHYGLGVSPEDIRIYLDPELGNEFRWESSTLKLIDELTSSAATASSVATTPVITVGSYKGTLPSMLATIHMLSIKSPLLRKRTPRLKEKIHFVNSAELRSIFNQRSGIGSNTKTLTVKIVKSLLSVITSVGNKRFPGSWISQNRALNDVKTDLGLLNKLGYVEKIVHNHKLQQVIFNDTVVKPNGKLSVRSKSDAREYKELSFSEFRAGCLLTSPRINISSSQEYNAQVKIEPLKVNDVSVVENFNDTKYYKAIDSLNKAHALLVSLPKGNTKTKAIHYQIARNEFLHNCSRIPVKNLPTDSMEDLRSLPKPVLDYCKSLYRFQNGPKRSVEEMQIDSKADSSPKTKKR
jgi:hypothetical protein